jgi:shikimate dehydrogenase
MKYVGVIGYPLGHTLSPVFHQAALDHLGLDIRYEAWETPPDDLAETVDRLRASDHLGANVTIPHKEVVIPLLEEMDELAQRVGAVNTIANRQGRLHGYNTDVGGFLRALSQDGGFDPTGTRVLVVGAGGVAHAVVAALVEAGAVSVTVTDLVFSRATRLVEDLRSFTGGTQLDALPATRLSWEAAAGCQLLVNCTPVGLAGTPEEKESPVPEDIITPGSLVFDLVYRPQETVLMAAARSRGARVLGGLSMLVYQGAASFEIWTGREPPVDIMLAAAGRALGDVRSEGGS